MRCGLVGALFLYVLPGWGLGGALVVGGVAVVLELVVLATLVPTGPGNRPTPLQHTLGPHTVEPVDTPLVPKTHETTAVAKQITEESGLFCKNLNFAKSMGFPEIAKDEKKNFVFQRKNDFLEKNRIFLGETEVKKRPN